MPDAEAVARTDADRARRRGARRWRRPDPTPGSSRSRRRRRSLVDGQGRLDPLVKGGHGCLRRFGTGRGWDRDAGKGPRRASQRRRRSRRETRVVGSRSNGRGGGRAKGIRPRVGLALWRSPARPGCRCPPPASGGAGPSAGRRGQRFHKPGRARPARVHRMELDRPPAEPPRPLADQRDLGALGTGVGARAVVDAVGVLEIVEVEMPGRTAHRRSRR